MPGLLSERPGLGDDDEEEGEEEEEEGLEPFFLSKRRVGFFEGLEDTKWASGEGRLFTKDCRDSRACRTSQSAPSRESRVRNCSRSSVLVGGFEGDAIRSHPTNPVRLFFDPKFVPKIPPDN